MSDIKDMKSPRVGRIHHTRIVNNMLLSWTSGGGGVGVIGRVKLFVCNRALCRLYHGTWGYASHYYAEH